MGTDLLLRFLVLRGADMFVLTYNRPLISIYEPCPQLL